MGRKLDLSGLSDAEAEHVLKVVQRDMKLRKKEEDRLCEMKQELAEEGSRCSILSKQHRFNEHCCIRCCAPFTFLLNPKRQCLDCRFNVCKTCRAYSKHDKAWLCSACQKTRLLRTQSLEWYYTNVKSRFKRFGSAKVLKTLYRKHCVERGTLSELPESSVNEGSNDNDGSVCGSDSAFYKQSEGHSMADTLTVALRVAEEAIEEAIAKAEDFSDSLEKQNEARYLRDHKEELIEELATTIVQKIIQRRKRSEMQAEYDLVWPQAQGHPQQPQPQPQSSELASPSRPPAPQDPQGSFRSSYSLWRSRSAFSLTSDDSPEKGPDEGARAGEEPQEYASLKREAKAASLPTWKSVDRLDNSCASSVLQSPDGNWIALQSSQLSRPSLLAKRKSLVFSALEEESRVASAYDGMGSGSDREDEGGWGAALQQFRRKLSDETYYTDSQHDPEWTYTPHLPVTSPSSGQYTNTETLNSDSETSSAPPPPRKPPHNLLRRKGAPEPLLHPHHHPHHQPHHHGHHHHGYQNHPPHRPEALDVNFNPTVVGDSSDAEERPSDHVKRSRRRRKSKREMVTEQGRGGNQTHTQSNYPLSQESSGFLLNALLKKSMSEDRSGPDPPPAGPPPGATSLGGERPVEAAPSPAVSGPPAPASPGGPGPGAEDTLERELQSKLSQIISRANSKEMSSSEEEEEDPGKRPRDGQADRPAETPRPQERERQRPAEKQRERPGGQERDVTERVNGPEPRRSEAPTECPTLRAEEKARERMSERGGPRREEKFEDGEERRERKKEGSRHQSKRQQRRALDQDAAMTGGQTRSESISPAVTPSGQEEALSDGQKYSAASLCSITTEVLKVLNATEELIGEAGGESHTPSESMSVSPISSSSETRRLDQRLTKMEENVYLAAGSVYGLEGALGDLEECARSISSGTKDTELAFLEDQVATAAAQVQESELQISDIEARISALKTAGLNVVACNRFSKCKPNPMPQTLDSSRHQRRKLPAPPVKETESEQQMRALRP